MYVIIDILYIKKDKNYVIVLTIEMLHELTNLISPFQHL